jgi:hypothetical protein
MRAHRALPALLLLATSGCYHYRFELRPEPSKAELVTHEVRVPTYLNGFVGTGRVEAARYCEHPVSTELEVTATDVLLSVVTLLIYTPHTLRVTCEQAEAQSPGALPEESR